jgi:hypothetical protein
VRKKQKKTLITGKLGHNFATEFRKYEKILTETLIRQLGNVGTGARIVLKMTAKNTGRGSAN